MTFNVMLSLKKIAQKQSPEFHPITGSTLETARFWLQMIPLIEQIRLLLGVFFGVLTILVTDCVPPTFDD